MTQTRVYCSVDASQLSSSDKMDSVLKADEEEGCSFLKIENVVSLALSVDNDGTESPIVSYRNCVIVVHFFFHLFFQLQTKILSLLYR